MKRAFGFSRKLMVLSSAVLLSAFALTSCDKNDDDNNNNSNMYTISGNANGSQFSPAVAGNGSGTITGTYNANTGQLTYTTNWAGLSGAPTSGAFFNGASGTTGTMVGSNWTMGTNLGTTGSYSGTMTLTPDQWNQLNGGYWYYSYGTAANPTGEIRGQITTAQVR